MTEETIMVKIPISKTYGLDHYLDKEQLARVNKWRDKEQELSARTEPIRAALIAFRDNDPERKKRRYVCRRPGTALICDARSDTQDRKSVV